MRRHQAIIFDWGNTLVDYPLRTRGEQIGFLRKFLLERVDQLNGLLRDDVRAEFPQQDWLDHFNGEGGSLVVRPFGSRFGAALRPTVPPSMLDDLERQLCDAIFASSQIIEGAPAILAAAHRAGLRVGILSNTPWGTSPRHWRAHLTGHAFVSDCCDSLVFCGDIGYRKPHQAVFEHCMRTLQTVPEKTAMVGDSLTSDVLGSLRCGLTAVWLNRHREPIADHQALNGPGRHVTVERLEQIAEALEF